MACECPNCRQPVPWTRTFFTPAWGRWRCHSCNALLAINVRRRVAGVAVCTAIPVLLLPLLRLPLTPLLILPLLIGLCVVFVVLLDRPVLLERSGFRCQECGYDLTGQVEPRCPECNREFELEALRRYQSALDHDRPPRRAMGRPGLILFIIALVLLTGMVVIGLVRYQRAAGTRPAPAPQSPTPTATANE